MNILYYYWTENSSDDICDCFQHLGYEYTKISHTILNYECDAEFHSYFLSVLKSSNFDIIFTFDYFPIISKIATEYHIPYISWIYDCPHNTLFSDTIYNEYNRIFFFDKNLYLYYKNRGLKNGFHMPLAINSTRLNKLLGTNISETNYQYDISFVGSLYVNGSFSQIKYMPSYLKGYTDGIMNAQRKIYGYNLIPDVLTPDIVNLFEQCISFNDEYIKIPHEQIYADFINEKITELDRISILNLLSKYTTVDLFTNSDISLLHNVNTHNPISYITEMPFVFRNSKINLNMTLRSITSGIPLRALDIMGCGGFLMSNYQPELAEYFIPGEDLILYDSDEDLLDKSLYYLEHEDERIEIAQNGFFKTQTHYSYEKILPQIFKKSDL